MLNLRGLVEIMLSTQRACLGHQCKARFAGNGRVLAKKRTNSPGAGNTAVVAQVRPNVNTISTSPLWILALLLFVAGCSGNIRYRDADIAAPSNPPEAYVTNPELTKELAILKESGLYKITADPAASTRITLWPLADEPTVACGNTVIATFMTLGVVPVLMPADYRFGFDIEDQDGKRQVGFILPMQERYSIWETFKIFHNENKELAKALRGSALGEQQWRRMKPGDIPSNGLIQ